MADELKPADQTPTTRFSLERLSSAFARLMGANKKPPTPRSPAVLAAGTSGADADEEEPPLPVTPRMIVEGLLFVGRADGRGLTLKELAAPIRNVDEAEVETLIAELNAAYAQDESPYEITCVDGAQRLQLRREMDRVKARMPCSKGVYQLWTSRTVPRP